MRNKSCNQLRTRLSFQLNDLSAITIVTRLLRPIKSNQLRLVVGQLFLFIPPIEDHPPPNNGH